MVRKYKSLQVFCILVKVKKKAEMISVISAFLVRKVVFLQKYRTVDFSPQCKLINIVD